MQFSEHDSDCNISRKTKVEMIFWNSSQKLQNNTIYFYGSNSRTIVIIIQS